MKSGIRTICDFDGVLFETDNFLGFLRNEITQQNPNKICVFDNLYNRFKENIAQLINNISSELSIPEKKLADLFYETNINPFLRKGSREFIQKMEDMGTFTIVTKGDPQFQKSKFIRLGLTGTVKETDKSQFISDQIQNAIEKQNKQQCIVIDDRLLELKRIYQSLPKELIRSVTFVHMQVGRHGKEGYGLCDSIFEAHIKHTETFSDVESALFPAPREPVRELHHHFMP